MKKEINTASTECLDDRRNGKKDKICKSFFKNANKPGRCLAYKLQQQRGKSIIQNLKIEKGVIKKTDKKK